MEAKKLRKYFLSGSLGLCIFGIAATVISAGWLVLRFSIPSVIVRIPIGMIILLIAGPVLLFITLKDTLKTFSLISKLKRNDALETVYRSLTNTDTHISYNKDDVILSDYFLFVKDSVAVVAYPQITRIYTQYTKNDKGEITSVQVYCDTLNKDKIKVFQNINNQYDLIQFVEHMKQKNSNIAFEI